LFSHVGEGRIHSPDRGFFLTNTPAFVDPAAGAADSNFGYSTSLVGSTGGRTINLSGRINF
jgi:hypothetical protein